MTDFYKSFINKLAIILIFLITAYTLHNSFSLNPTRDTDSNELPHDLSRNIDFEELLTYFNNIQQKHRIYKHQKIKQQLQSNVDPLTQS